MAWYPEKTYTIRKVSGGFILKCEKDTERVFASREDLYKFLFPEDFFDNDPDPHYGPGEPVTAVVTVSAGGWGQSYGQKYKKSKMRPIEDGDDHMTIKEFIKNVKSGLLTDDDGFGEYATETMVSDIAVNPFNIDDLDATWTHVVWYNK